MDLNNKNGQPSMEEILASIRRIIAEEPTAANPVIDLHAKYRNKSEDHDENNDFELPSIFRPVAPAPERQPLFGRLTDAIRNASTGAEPKNGRKNGDAEGSEQQDRYRGALRDSVGILAVANGQGGLEGTGGPGHQDNDAPDRYRGALRDAAGASTLSSALSSLKLTRGAESTPLPDRYDADSFSPVAQPTPEVVRVVQQPAPAPAPTLQAAGSSDDIRRVMVPFRDMRMSKMATESVATPTPIADSSALEALMQGSTSQVSAAAHVDFPAPPIHEAFQAPLAPIPAPPQAFDDALSLDEMHRFAAIVQQPVHRPPPPPQAVAAPASEAAGGIEDTTADLLRPMLRQWLAENMPRMVEKALSIELAQSVKSNRKFNGY